MPAGVVLHFGEIDRVARVWLDGEPAGEHEGGYTPFSIAVPPSGRADGGVVEVTVCADDDPSDLSAPRGKQDWQPEPHSIWYPRTSGIWRTVWCERVPPHCISDVRWSSDAASMTLSVTARCEGGQQVKVRLRVGDRQLVDDGGDPLPHAGRLGAPR